VTPLSRFLTTPANRCNTFDDGQHRLGVLTDSGSITRTSSNVLRACDGLVLECNHDTELLAASRYPAQLKQRIGGRFRAPGEWAGGKRCCGRSTRSRLQHVVAAHLSQENNRPQLASRALPRSSAAARTGSGSPTRRAASPGGS
jgi:phosphoribosyl 1,2-cyclic phosphodiesterase